MTYETFRREVLQGLQSRDIGNASLSLTKKLKSNGQIRYGIVFNNPATNTSPTIYLEEYYGLYQLTGNFTEIVNALVHLYRSLPAIQVNEKELYDFSTAKDRIIMKLINTEKNRAFLETVPHIPFQDLSIVYFYFMGKEGNRFMDMPVNDDLIRRWGIDTLTLHQQAMANYNRLLPIKFGSLNQLLLERGLLDKKDYAALSEDGWRNALYCLTNEFSTGGAVLMTCKNLMDKIADFLGEDFYILPSSTHEVLLLPESRAPSKEELDQRIQEVNREALKPEDYLSDHAYYYSRSGQDLGGYKSLFQHSPGIIS